MISVERHDHAQGRRCESVHLLLLDRPLSIISYVVTLGHTQAADALALDGVPVMLRRPPMIMRKAWDSVRDMRMKSLLGMASDGNVCT
jgi:hypothetical protein